MGQDITHARRAGRPRILPIPEYVAEPWGRQPAGVFSKRAESQYAYELFSEYFLQDPDRRSLDDLAARHGKQVSTLRSMSSTYAWGPRCAAHDRHLAEQRMDSVVAQALTDSLRDYERARRLEDWANKGILTRDPMDEKLADVTKVAQYADGLRAGVHGTHARADALASTDPGALGQSVQELTGRAFRLLADAGDGPFTARDVLRMFAETIDPSTDGLPVRTGAVVIPGEVVR